MNLNTQTTQMTMNTTNNRIKIAKRLTASAVAASVLVLSLGTGDNVLSASPVSQYTDNPASYTEPYMTLEEQSFHRQLVIRAQSLQEQAFNLRMQAQGIRKADRSDATMAAAGDGLSTLGVLSMGGAELNPLLPGSPLGVVGVTLFKMWLAQNVDVMGEKEQDQNSRMMSAGWGGATVANVVSIAGLALPIALPIGLASAVMLYKSKTGEGSSEQLMTKANAYQAESASMFATAQSYQRSILLASLKRNPSPEAQLALADRSKTGASLAGVDLRSVGRIGPIGEASENSFPVANGEGALRAVESKGAQPHTFAVTMTPEQAEQVRRQLQAGLDGRGVGLVTVQPLQVAQANPAPSTEQPMDAATAAAVARQLESGLRMRKSYAVPVVKPETSPAGPISWTDRLRQIQDSVGDRFHARLRTAADVYERAIAYVRLSFPETVALFKSLELSSEQVAKAMEPMSLLPATFGQPVKVAQVPSYFYPQSAGRVVREPMNTMVMDVGAPAMSDAEAFEMSAEGGAQGLSALPVQELRTRTIVTVRPAPVEFNQMVGPKPTWFGR